MRTLKLTSVLLSAVLLLGCSIQLEKSQSAECEESIRVQMRLIEEGADPGSFSEPGECYGLTDQEIVEIMEEITGEDWEDFDN